jgi:hypothetical protein
MTEEFRVNQVWRDSTTVDADEGASGARGTGVDSTGDDFFTRAAATRGRMMNCLA